MVLKRCVQSVCICQDHEDSSTESGRNHRRRETAEGIRKRYRTIQSTITARVPILHCVCRPNIKFVSVDLLKAKREAQVSLKKFVLIVKLTKNLSLHQEFHAQTFKMYSLDECIPREKSIHEKPQQNGSANRCSRVLMEKARCFPI